MSENPGEKSLRDLGGKGELHDLSALEPELRRAVKWVINSSPEAVAKLALSTPDDTTAVRLEGLKYAVTHVLTARQCTDLAIAIAQEKPGKCVESGVLKVIVGRASESVRKSVRDALGWNVYPNDDDYRLDVVL